MWHEYLKEEVNKKTSISELDSILGKNNDLESDSDALGEFYFIFINEICKFDKKTTHHSA